MLTYQNRAVSAVQNLFLLFLSGVPWSYHPSKWDSHETWLYSKECLVLGLLMVCLHSDLILRILYLRSWITPLALLGLLGYVVPWTVSGSTSLSLCYCQAQAKPQLQLLLDWTELYFQFPLSTSTHPSTHSGNLFIDQQPSGMNLNGTWGWLMIIHDTIW